MRQIVLLFLIISFVNAAGVFSIASAFAQGAASAEVSIAAIEDAN